MTCNVGTAYCMAPEVVEIQSTRYNEKVDVYSFGILLWELLSNGDTPYSNFVSGIAIMYNV